jgi:pimeloyl-ACP methyl ester carboxylesterase
LSTLEILDLPGAEPSLVFLHEGLGSVAMWRDFPTRVAAATGRRTIVYSRMGYGKSPALRGPREPDYMHREALEALPALRAELGLADPVLVGHSDGASIALIHAGGGHPVRGIVAMAPHVFVEDVTVRSIEAAREAWATTDLPARLGRYHDDAEGAFRGWNDAWLDPRFRAWNIEAYLPHVACPVLAIQGRQDEYGTMAQLDAIERQVKGHVRRLELEACRHSPHRDRPDRVLAAIASFVAEV